MEYIENDMTLKIDDPNNYLLPKLSESRSYQLYDFELQHGKTAFTLPQFTRNEFAHLLQLPEIAFEAQWNQGRKKRLFQ